MGKISDALERYSRERTNPISDRLTEVQSEDVREESASPGKNGFSYRLPVVSEPGSWDAERFKVLRSQIIFPENGHRPKTILVASAFPGEGKTFVAANLAASIALGVNEHVLAIDCDFRHPGLHEILDCPNDEGLHEHLAGKKRLDELIIRTRIDKLSLLTTGSPPWNPTELVSSSMMRDFLEEVKLRYDDRYIIIDSTPSRVTAEARVLAKRADGIILVVMAYRGNRIGIQESIETLGREKILGVVLNGYNKIDKECEDFYKSYCRRA